MKLKVQRIQECRCETCSKSIFETPGISITAIARFAISVLIGGIVWAVNV